MNASRQVSWEFIRWRALAHVTRDALLESTEDWLSVSLLHGFVEDALGAERNAESVPTTLTLAVELVGSGYLVPARLTSTGVEPVSIPSEALSQWVQDGLNSSAAEPLTFGFIGSQRAAEWSREYYRLLSIVRPTSLAL